jgi:hypothetical protein
MSSLLRIRKSFEPYAPVAELDNSIKLYDLHEKQQLVYQELTRFGVLKCGRRFGKTRLALKIGIGLVTRGGEI